MGWRNECVSSVADANTFLRHQISCMNPPELEFRFDSSRGFLFIAEARINRKIEQLFFMEMTQLCHWKQLNVLPSFRGKGLGLMAIKAALAYAKESGNDRLFIWNVHYNGPSFWPTLGAVCYHREVPNVGCHIESSILPQSALLTPDDCLALAGIVALSRKDALAAWRTLSQSDFRFRDGSLVKERVFKNLCYADNLLLDLGDEETRKILRKHVGAIPDIAVLPDRRAVSAKQGGVAPPLL